MVGVILHNYFQKSESESYCPRGMVGSEANGDFYPGEWTRIVQDDGVYFIPFGRY